MHWRRLQLDNHFKVGDDYHKSPHEEKASLEDFSEWGETAPSAKIIREPMHHGAECAELKKNSHLTDSLDVR